MFLDSTYCVGNWKSTRNGWDDSDKNLRNQNRTKDVFPELIMNLYEFILLRKAPAPWPFFRPVTTWWALQSWRYCHLWRDPKKHPPIQGCHTSSWRRTSQNHQFVHKRPLLPIPVEVKETTAKKNSPPKICWLETLTKTGLLGLSHIIKSRLGLPE